MTATLRGAAVPIDIGPDAARAAAERELLDPAYHQDDPSLVERGARWLVEQLFDLLSRAGSVTPGGYTGLVVLGLVLVVVAVLIRLRVGPAARTIRGTGALFDAAPRTAEDHRRAADRHAAQGEWAEAIRERLRGVVRGLEERDLLAARPGRTAGELAAEAGQVLPGSAAALRDAAHTFDEVWYGGRPATAPMDARLRALDQELSGSRPVLPGTALR